MLKKPFDILLVEDHVPDAEHLRLTFKSIPVVNKLINFETHCKALDYLKDNQDNNVGLVIVDYYTNDPHKCYLEILDYCSNRGLPIVVLTGYNDVMHSIEAIHHGAWLYLSKPIKKQDLINLVDAIDDLALEIVNLRQLKDAM